VDGTLVDTNYLHSVAWRRAFLAAGHDVPTAEVHRRVGMSGGRLLHELIGEESDDVKDRWKKEFHAMAEEIRALPGASALLRAVASRGADVVLATSSEEDDLELLLGALDGREVLRAVTSAGDVDEAKPEPEVFETALAKVGGSTDAAIVVGDTVWDVEAARRAGLDCVCVLTGGIARGELEAAGAVAVYRSPADLLDHIDTSPLARLLS
jgi:HAD superfamily hydrolase (TIGR01549 family)